MKKGEKEMTYEDLEKSDFVLIVQDAWPLEGFEEYENEVHIWFDESHIGTRLGHIKLALANKKRVNDFVFLLTRLVKIAGEEQKLVIRAMLDSLALEH